MSLSAETVEPVPPARGVPAPRAGDAGAARLTWDWTGGRADAGARRAARHVRVRGAITGACGAAVGAALLLFSSARVLPFIVFGIAAVTTTTALASPLGAHRWVDRAIGLLALAIGTLFTGLLLVPFYYLVFLPFGLAFRRGAKDPMTDPGFELVTAVLSTADAFLREGHRLFRPHGLTSAQYNVLNILADEPVGISQRELGDRLVVDRSNVTGLLDRMEAAGWVRRGDHPQDRRVYRVLLTPQGRALWKKIHPRYLQVVDQVTEGLAPSKMTDGAKMLRRLAAAATEWKLR